MQWICDSCITARRTTDTTGYPSRSSAYERERRYLVPLKEREIRLTLAALSLAMDYAAPEINRQMASVRVPLGLVLEQLLATGTGEEETDAPNR